MSATRLIIDGNAVYEIDEECMKKRQMRDQDKRGMQAYTGRERSKSGDSANADSN